MKTYEVSIDVTMSVTIDVEAENEEQAKLRANHYLADDPHYYIRKNGNLLSHEVYEVNEVEGEKEE